MTDGGWRDRLSALVLAVTERCAVHVGCGGKCFTEGKIGRYRCEGCGEVAHDVVEGKPRRSVLIELATKALSELDAKDKQFAALTADADIEQLRVGIVEILRRERDEAREALRELASASGLTDIEKLDPGDLRTHLTALHEDQCQMIADNAIMSRRVEQLEKQARRKAAIVRRIAREFREHQDEASAAISEASAEASDWAASYEYTLMGFRKAAAERDRLWYQARAKAATVRRLHDEWGSEWVALAVERSQAREKQQEWEYAFDTHDCHDEKLPRPDVMTRVLDKLVSERDHWHRKARKCAVVAENMRAERNAAVEERDALAEAKRMRDDKD